METSTAVSTQSPHGVFKDRAVIWKRLAGGGYASAKLLPLAPGYSGSLAGGIWSKNGTVYVAGDQWNGEEQAASLWSPSSHLTVFPTQLPFISSMGGSGTHVFAAGTTYSEGVSSAWIARISHGPSGEVSLTSPRILPMLAGYNQEYGEGVSSDSHGNPVVVGEAEKSGPTMSVRGVEWTGGRAELVNKIIGPSKWSIVGASGINGAGDIVGEELYKGTDHAIMIEPLRSSPLIATGIAN